MSDLEEDLPEEASGKRGKKDKRSRPLPSTPEEIEALIRRQKRNLRKAWAEGYLTAITAMLKPGDLAVDCGANMGVVTERLAATGADVIAFVRINRQCHADQCCRRGWQRHSSADADG